MAEKDSHEDQGKKFCEKDSQIVRRPRGKNVVQKLLQNFHLLIVSHWNESVVIIVVHENLLHKKGKTQCNAGLAEGMR